ncbi:MULTISPECIES: aldehyde dehydrogenase family protein [unclassified Ensifer]|uniref:aldehyde dehydrogenase family protein n=1 Tax=unclassified Ensifer TaxID=2633371 RepID=UPI000812E853|nr:MULTISPECIES: aldehyde dehydrogenase family protein [unclassified Ensifer]OCP00460.1 aldehyde dehydrogenase [Ensifer sp. LC14]OCP05951.1 aldehyde dehydrogenase [Ensifer sp. LC11]OCP06579.1 aldehyde dehydrogenase [Ensifer sp. LC13]OCP31181.1 aldehyde dehydrogenase [Ensifer sp. LC499]
MKFIEQIYVDGAFVTPHGNERFDLFNPATEEKIGEARLGDGEDAGAAVAAAKRAFPAMRRTTVAERVSMLLALRDAVATRADALCAAMATEYGAPQSFLAFSVPHASKVFDVAAKTVADYAFRRRIGNADVVMEPVGVAAAITPWNSNIGFICTKLTTAVAAGTTIVIKPSELSAIQTQTLVEVLHEAGLPRGVLNVVNGYGHVVGADLSRHPHVAKVTFTGSTTTGRTILRTAAESFKRVTLELGGKGTQILLDDADLDRAIPHILASAFRNSGQACIAGTRLLVPQQRYEEVSARLADAVSALKVGPSSDPASDIGPMVSARQWERVQSYIRLGQQEGATLLVGGEGRPQGLDRGWFVRPTVFANVTNDMRIAREEIFGPVLSVLRYQDEDEAIAVANDTDYGLQSYVLGSDIERMRAVALRLEAGRVVINETPAYPQTPFGGFKHSGIGREFGPFGLEAFLEPKAIIG